MTEFTWEGIGGCYRAQVRGRYVVFVKLPGSCYFTEADAALRDLILDLAKKGLTHAKKD